ncbi:hypothetical protein Plano_0536 [Planococcus sp. PAMC 21323]|uniref:hypothetical protein n=1 Tax=Planococcus sp. PAMC 21323 TaxID=1526927 RepID=UPI0005701BBC|nr:hypothetical protein [Planococcus sp. PAMC 21323]AIY04501.1 hypothetical protein Plano_0536 [Planococcus sp. PAMC 21323]
MQHLLSEFQLRRLDWAFEAKDSFLNNFQIFDAVEKMTENKKVVVSVYGPTQVGKTTLILSLLGIKGNYLEEITEFLRGKRDAGKSATVTVTKYKISPTEDYIIKLPNQKDIVIHTPTQLEEHMMQLRHQVETGAIRSVEPVMIAIPKSKFNDQETKIELIDLPGIESAEEKEVKHVERCVNYWIPNSHICLIVNGAGDLTFLRDIQMLQLKNWYDYPEKYFVVLTRAFSPESVQRRIDSNQIKNTNEVMDYYNKQVQEIIKIPPGTIYPIEIGQSLKRLTQAEKLLADDIFTQLKEKVRTVDFHKISFSFLTGYYQEILKKSEKEIENLEFAIKEKEEEHCFLLKLLSKSDMEKKKVLRKLSEQKSVLKENQQAFVELYEKVFKKSTLSKLVKSSYDSKNPEKKASKLNQLTSTIIFEVEDKLKDTLKEMNKYLEEVNEACELTRNEKLLMNENVEIIFDNWDYSKMDNYISKKNFNAKKQSMSKSLTESVSKTCIKVQNSKSKLKVKWEVIEQDFKDREYRVTNRFNVKEQELQELIRIKKDEIRILEKELKVDLQHWNRDLEHATKYRNYFIKHFLVRKESLLKMAVSDNVEERYLANLYLYTLGSDATKIINSLEFNHGDKTKKN